MAPAIYMCQKEGTAMPSHGLKVLALSGGILLATQGCAALGLTAFGAGAGVAGGTGTSYTLDSVAYRTFTISVDDMRRATLSSLKRMDIKVQTDEAIPEGRRLVAQAGDRSIDIELERTTSTPLTLDEIAAKKQGGQGWGEVFKSMQSQGLVQEKNLGQVVSKYNHSTKGVVTTASGRVVSGSTSDAKAQGVSDGSSSPGNSGNAGGASNGKGNAFGASSSSGGGAAHSNGKGGK